MTDDKQVAAAETPFWRVALVLWVIALAGAGLVLPYVATLERNALVKAAAHTHLSLWQLLAASALQSAILLGVAVVLGLWAANRLGLGAPLISALVNRLPPPRAAILTLLFSFAIGLALGVVVLVMDRYVFAPIPSVAVLIHGAAVSNVQPGRWQGLLASFYGAFDEEILMRLGLLSLLALLFRTLVRALGARREIALPAGVFWIANIVAAVLFGLGHLPGTATLAPLTTAIVVRAIVLNGIVGLVSGLLFRRYGLEWGMASHFGADVVLHVAAS